MTETKPDVNESADQPISELPVENMPQSLGRSFRSWKTWLSFALAIAIIVVMFRGLNIDFQDSWRQIRQSTIGFFLIALLCYYAALFIRGYRWTGMLRQVGISRETGYHVPNLWGMFEIIVLSWFANSILPAKLGDAYRGFLIKRRANASFGTSFGTILAERLIDLVMLVLVLLASGVIVFGLHAPGRTQQAFVWGGTVVLIGVIGVVILWLLRDRLERFMPSQALTHYRRLHGGLFQVLANPLRPALLSVCIWLLDGLRVYLIARSLGWDLHISESIMVALISALVSVIPFTPAGLGFVETFMVTALTQIGVVASTAAAIALLDRVVTYLSLIIVGVPLYFWVLRREVTSATTDAG